MIALLLILLPLAAAVAAWPIRRENSARILLLLSACVHTGLTVCCVTLPPAMSSFRWNGQEWIGLDDAGMIFLMVTSLLFLFVALHTVLESVAEGKNGSGLFREHFHLPCLLGFLATMTLVITARNFGLLWVAVEATTLVSAPLILLHRSGRSLEAMWKYLLICSVGIGFALLGTMLTAVSARAAGAAGLSMSDLAACSAAFPDDWFKAAFVLILAGYGTKTGLAPFHTWLPDAHSEAPATVSALLSGSLLNCSFLAVIRFCQIAPEEVRPFCNELLTALGILSLVVAAFFIIRQSDFKRMLAYSSVEHMGLAALLWGCGLESISFLHLCGHSILKMTLFLLAGNFFLACGTRSVDRVGGLLGTMPRNAVLWIAAVLLICGTPPSPLFVTEYLLVQESGLWFGALVLFLLFAVFAGMTMAALKMCMGPEGVARPEEKRIPEAERLCFVPALALILALAAGCALTVLFNQGAL